MSYQDHFNACPYCQEDYRKKSKFGFSERAESKLKPTIKIKSASALKPTIKIKSAASREKERKLTELGALIKGTSYPSLSPISMLQKTKGASLGRNNLPKPGPIEKEMKLRALARLISG